MSHSMQESQQGKAKDFFLARQPILNREQALYAYELLFRGGAGSTGANVVDDLSATASVIAHAAELGLHNVIGSAFGFVNLDARVLMSDFLSVLPADKVVLEILETVEVTPDIVARVEMLHRAGYRIALDDVVADSSDLRQLFPYVSIVKIDIMGMPEAELRELVAKFAGSGKRLLAEKVETVEEFNLCLALGFEYFQGYYFSKPVVMQGKKLSTSQLAILQIMSLINGDADTPEIESAIKRDAALGMTLLRLVNTPAVGAAKRIESLGQALVVLGRKQLLRWLQIMLYADSTKQAGPASPLLLLATTRARLLELVCQRVMPNQRGSGDMAFTVGIMSLMDTLFSMPMTDIVKQIPVSDDVEAALIRHAGLFGDMLALIEAVEHGTEPEHLTPLLTRLGLHIEELTDLQMQAYAWVENVAHHA